MLDVGCRPTCRFASVEFLDNMQGRTLLGSVPSCIRNRRLHRRSRGISKSKPAHTILSEPCATSCPRYCSIKRMGSIDSLARPCMVFDYCRRRRTFVWWMCYSGITNLGASRSLRQLAGSPAAARRSGPDCGWNVEERGLARLGGSRPKGQRLRPGQCH